MALQLVKITPSGQVRVHFSSIVKPALSDMFQELLETAPPMAKRLNQETVGEHIAISLMRDVYKRLSPHLCAAEEPSRITMSKGEALTLWSMLSYSGYAHANAVMGNLYMALHQKLQP